MGLTGGCPGQQCWRGRYHRLFFFFLSCQISSRHPLLLATAWTSRVQESVCGELDPLHPASWKKLRRLAVCLFFSFFKPCRWSRNSNGKASGHPDLRRPIWKKNWLTPERLCFSSPCPLLKDASVSPSVTAAGSIRCSHKLALTC